MGHSKRASALVLAAERTKRWYRQRPLLLVLVLLMISLLVGFVVEQALDDAAASLQMRRGMVAGAVIALFLIVGLISLLLFNRKDEDTAPTPPPEGIVERNVFSAADLVQIRHGLHDELYRGVAPEDDALDRMYEKNPKMGVALYDTSLKDFVAFATAWPLTDEAGEALIRGARNENDLTADDVLAAADNCRANYVLVPAFGATKLKRAQLGRDLFYKLCKTLRRNFFARRNRSITLIATGYSPDGRRWCEGHGMVAQCHVAMDGKQYPIFTRRITYDDL